jgi:hypothetical protein
MSISKGLKTAEEYVDTMSAGSEAEVLATPHYAL